MHYFAIVQHDPGSAYGVSFPDVPDCFAAADEAADISKHAIAALDDYFADLDEVPVPRDIEEIRAEVSDVLAEGAYILSVPYIPRDTIKVRKNVSVERGLWDAAEQAASEVTNGNVSAFLELAVRNEILIRQGQVVPAGMVRRAYRQTSEL
ncbi:type II toxin-antitoxin system HicB family antitoxin [Ruegeria lacuscaerulensis]|uniref:type II toxin-antitoxin system HicB family antitoxin n=1 Tax=Ruegeria lacuscaerulensis TaxID=55218 RepID=UPI00147A793D|nr:type II toxin-antitoxin system HicB family antitoxin [Ruegeria lacuscaerulensis]